MVIKVVTKTIENKLTDLVGILAYTLIRLAGTEQLLANTQFQLQNARIELLETQRMLMNTHSDLLDMQSKLAEMQSKLADTEQMVKDLDSKLRKSLFRLENMKENDVLVKLYTGFNDYETLETFYEEMLESDATVMQQ